MRISLFPLPYYLAAHVLDPDLRRAGCKSVAGSSLACKIHICHCADHTSVSIVEWVDRYKPLVRQRAEGARLRDRQSTLEIAPLNTEYLIVMRHIIDYYDAI